MAKAPKISVLMPVYKTNERYLREAIESVLAQTVTDFEFLILDDCPADDRESIVKSYRDPRIKYVKNERNLGITPSRNKLIDMAKGEYLAVFDHDDVSLPARFEKQVAYLDAHPKCGVVGSFAERFPKTKRLQYPIEDRKIKEYLMFGCAVLHPASMLRRSVLGALRYEEKFSPAEDYALWCRLMEKTNFHNIPEVLFKYRDHETNTSKLQSQKMARATSLIHSFVRKDHPTLWAHVQKECDFWVFIRLFGLIQIKKRRQKGMALPWYLAKNPFLKIKMKPVLEEK